MASSLLLAGLAVGVFAPSAQANRGSNPTTTTTEPAYVPPFGQNPRTELPDASGPSANPVVAPPVVPVDLPAVTDPGADLSGGGTPLEDVVPNADADRPDTPTAKDSLLGGILSRTGADTLPLARAGLAALTLGLGLVIVARRRRTVAATARV